MSKNKNLGFSLIEILVVIAIVGMISAVVMVSLTSARAKGRDAKRKADMGQLQKALEIYYNSNNSFPITGSGNCANGNINNGGGNGNNPSWYGYSTSGGSKTTSGTDAYIPGLTPNYVAVLPVDPKGATNNWSGYTFCSDGTSYKLLDNITGPESFPNSGEPFYDPVRPNSAWMVCVGQTACDTW